MQRFDLIVIGSGPGGYRSAVLGALRGLGVAIVEKTQWGGCCLNRGCVPKRDWHHSAKLIAASRRFPERGIGGKLQVDLQQAWRHQEQVVAKVTGSYTDYMERLGVLRFTGTARFVDANTVAIDADKNIAGHNIIIATGATPDVPNNFELTPDRILTTDELFDTPPPAGKRVAVIGSGMVGTEFAFILAMLGLQVTWIRRSKALSRTGFSQPALKLLNAAFDHCAVDIRHDRHTKQAHVDGKGVCLQLNDDSEIVVDWILLGTGRKPYTAGLGIDRAGVGTDADGFIEVNEFLQTYCPHIYAIGDVANAHMTANHALADATVAISNIVAPGSRRRDNRAVPEVVYSALELGRIGMNEDQAEEAGLEPATGFAAFDANPRALGQDDTDGFVRLVSEIDSGDLLGAEIVGSEAGELIQLVAQEYGKNDALNRFASAFYNHPARIEELLNATETLASRWGLAPWVFASGL
ncbi:MAG: dihydrolipoyl dehydrogenase family protein [Burkholderiales bacterium]